MKSKISGFSKGNVRRSGQPQLIMVREEILTTIQYRLFHLEQNVDDLEAPFECYDNTGPEHDELEPADHPTQFARCPHCVSEPPKLTKIIPVFSRMKTRRKDMIFS